MATSRNGVRRMIKQHIAGLIVYNPRLKQYGVCRLQSIQTPYPYSEGEVYRYPRWESIQVINIIDPETYEEKARVQAHIGGPITDFMDWYTPVIPWIYTIQDYETVSDTIYDLGKFIGFRDMMENTDNWHISVTIEEDYEVEEHYLLKPKEMWERLKQIMV